MIHWETKVYLSLFDLQNLTKQCLDKIENLLQEIKADNECGIEYRQCQAELLYLKRSILVMAMTASSQEPIKEIEDIFQDVPQLKTDLLVVKYYVKALLKNDEFEIDTESKVGYQQLLQAQSINDSVLVREH